MNILFLVFNLVGKGTYWRAYHLAHELVARGHQVTLVATAPHERLHLTSAQHAGLTLVETPDLLPGSLRSGWDPYNTLRRVLWVRNHRYDVVHSFETRPTVLAPALFAKHAQRTPLVLDWADWFGRGGSVEERPNPVQRALLRPVETFFEERFRGQAAATTVICSTLRHRAEALGVAPATILDLPNGCNTARFHPLDVREARRRVGLDPTIPIVGYCGTIFPKDAQLMAAAFDRLRAELPDARLLVAGYCPVDIHSLVRDPATVIQTGYLSDDAVNDYLNAADVCWLPFCDTNANRGRWPMKINDYMAVGRATVATDVGDVGELLRHEPIGLLADANADAIAQQTLRLLDDDEQRAHMGRHARALALTRFSWATLAAQLEALYATIV